LELEPRVPVIVDVVDFVTAFVVIVNVPVEAPAAMDTVDPTVAEVADEASLTLMAPVELPGTAFKVIVPVLEAPPTTDVGDKLSVEIANGATVKEAVFDTELNVPVIVVEVEADTTL
jgi:hypothetical protein